MDREQVVGYIGTPEMMEKYFLRVKEAEAKMGPLSEQERITILKSLASPITLIELTDMMEGKRALLIKPKKPCCPNPVEDEHDDGRKFCFNCKAEWGKPDEKSS